jgi:2-C-methyl-D-erythritol 2,4-cyclodiphosphate synthase
MIRVGQGVDVHAFDETRPLILGGVRISDTGGLAGHSDADAVLHAITDALLGAAGAGDIGRYFPSDDARWKDADSTIFLMEAKRVVIEMEAEIANIDVTIIAEKPKLAPFREAMEGRIAKLLDLPAGHVNVKATTTDRLGFIGRGEGICAMAVVLLQSQS